MSLSGLLAVASLPGNAWSVRLIVRVAFALCVNNALATIVPIEPSSESWLTTELLLTAF